MFDINLINLSFPIKLGKNKTNIKYLSLFLFFLGLAMFSPILEFPYDKVIGSFVFILGLVIQIVIKQNGDR